MHNMTNLDIKLIIDALYLYINGTKYLEQIAVMIFNYRLHLRE